MTYRVLRRAAACIVPGAAIAPAPADAFCGVGGADAALALCAMAFGRRSRR